LEETIETPTEAAAKAKEKKKEQAEDEDESEKDDEEAGAADDLTKAKKMKWLVGGERSKAAQQRTLLEPAKWRKVCVGIQIVAAGIGIWALALVLHAVPVLIGAFNPGEYADPALRHLGEDQTRQTAGTPLKGAEFGILLFAGKDSYDLATTMIRIANVS